MQTYSHFIMTALLNRTLRARQTAAGRLAWLPPAAVGVGRARLAADNADLGDDRVGLVGRDELAAGT